MKYLYWCNTCQKLIKGRSKRTNCFYCKGNDIVLIGIPLDEIPGLTLKYQLKLKEVGIINVLGLAKSDVTELSRKSGISKKKISEWIDLAKLIHPDVEFIKRVRDVNITDLDEDGNIKEDKK